MNLKTSTMITGLILVMVVGLGGCGITGTLSPHGLSEGTASVGPTTAKLDEDEAHESKPVVSVVPAAEPTEPSEPAEPPTAEPTEPSEPAEPPPVKPTELELQALELRGYQTKSAAIEENKKSPVFLHLAEKIGEDDAECLAVILWNDFDSIMTEEFIDEFIIDHSPGYDADNVTIIGDSEAPSFLEIAQNSLDRLYGYSPELYQYAIEDLSYIRGINFGTRCGGGRTGGPWMEVNTYKWIYDYKDVPLNEQPPVYGLLFVHEATHVKNRELERSGQIRKLTSYENEAIAYLAHGYYAKEYDSEGQGVLGPRWAMTLKEFVMRWVFRCIEEPEDYVWDWDFYVTVLEKGGFPPEELEKLTAYLGIPSTAPVISNIQISNITPDSVTISWDTNKLATSELEYSLNSDLSSSTIAPCEYIMGKQPFAMIHDYNLVNLSHGRTYYYRITVTEVSRNSSVSSILQFLTE